MSEGKNLVGVDIGSSSIKVCEIKEVKNARTLVRFGYHPLPPQTVVDGHVINPDKVLEGLDRLFHKQRLRDVALRISGHSVIIKKISMPLMNHAELREQVTFEAEHHIPFDLAEVEMDWEITQRRPDQGQMDVLLVAAKKEEVTDLKDLVLKAKLKPRVIDLDAFTIQNAFEVGYGVPGFGQTVALVHVGASLTTLNILSNGTTTFTRDIANGGNQITEEIQKQLSISWEEAEAYKCGAADLAPPEVANIMTQVIEQVAGEIQRSLDFYLATSGEGEVQNVFLSGGTANIRALTEAIGRRSRAYVDVFNVTRIATIDPKTVDTSLLTQRATQSVVAFGLALRKDREKVV